MSALKMYVPVEAPAPKLPGLGDSRRSAGSWPEAFTKQRGLIATELRQPEPDSDFWIEEMQALSDAEFRYEDVVEQIDHEIIQLENKRRQAIRQIADGLPERSNIREFLRRDDPAGYLRW